MLQLSMKHSTKHIMVKIDPGVQVNTITLSRYHKLFPHKVTQASTSKQQAIHRTSQIRISHNDKLHTFLGQFVADDQHKSQPRSYHTNLYVFEYVMNPQILLSYATSEPLGILEFKVPNEAAESHIDAVTLPSPKPSSGFRKTAKRVTFKHPLEFQPHNPSPSCSTRKTMKTVQFKEPLEYTSPYCQTLPSGT